MFLAIFLSLFLSLSLSHPTHYPQVIRNLTCYEVEPAPIYSWHVHFLYWQTNPNHTAGAFQIRDKFMQAFKNKLGAPCTDLFHQDHLCMFDPDTEPVGPFLTAQWSIFVPNENFFEVSSWAAQHRGQYDILIHPNSGCELEDHTWWALWGGNPWEINMDAFSYDQPFPWVEKSAKELKEDQNTTEIVKTFLTEH